MARPEPAKSAHERLTEAWRLFQWSTDPQVIDQAIAAMLQAEEELGLPHTTALDG